MKTSVNPVNKLGDTTCALNFLPFSSFLKERNNMIEEYSSFYSFFMVVVLPVYTPWEMLS